MSNKNLFPNLFIPGAGKSGTGSLHLYLNQHPDIYMCEIKEPHFFCNDFKYLNRKHEYFSLFQNKRNYKYMGESSTGYSFLPNSVERIKEDILDPKFIFILRNPVDRAWSHYWWLKGMGSENRNFKEVFLDDFKTIPNWNAKLPIGAFDYYYQCGCYAKWLKRFYDYFDKGKILILKTESLKKNPQETLNICFDFLGVDRILIQETESNVTIILKNPKLFSIINKLVRKENKLVPFLGNFFNEQTKKKIRPIKKKIKQKKYDLLSTLKNMNKSKKKYPKIEEKERKFIAKYYIKDMSELKRITSVNFDEWYDFN